MKSQKLYFKNSNDIPLCGILSGELGDKKPVVAVLCHGFATSKESRTYLDLESRLFREGIDSFRFDFFGHGESGGRFEDITVSEAVDDVLCSVAFVRQLGYERIFLVGSSFGGLASIIAAAEIPELTALVLKSPVSDYISRLLVNNDGVNVEEWKTQGFIELPPFEGSTLRLNYGFYPDAEKNSGYDSAGKIGCPVLIVHGNEDESVPLEQSLKLNKIIPDCSLQIIHGADHRYSRPEDFEDMLDRITRFLVDNIS
ncbi:alpha/beta hydrolase family protein [Acidobacteriota bacterium]